MVFTALVHFIGALVTVFRLIEKLCTSMEKTEAKDYSAYTGYAHFGAGLTVCMSSLAVSGACRWTGSGR